MFRHFAKRLAAAYLAFSNAVSDLVGETAASKKLIRIGAGDSVYQWLLLPILEELEQRCPLVAFEFNNLRTPEVVDQLQSGKIDLGIASFRAYPQGLEIHELRRLEFGLFYRKQAFRGETIAEILKQGKLVGLRGSGSYVNAVREHQRRANLSEHFWLTFDSLPMVASSMIRTEACAFLPLEAKEDLEQQGFGCIVEPSLKAFSRSYSLVAAKHSGRIRPKVAEVAEQMAGLLR